MNLADVTIPPDVPGALTKLRRNGFRLIMITNQPNVARGVQCREIVYAINRYLRNQLNLDSVEICEHDDADNCGCRKPKAGMLLRAAARDNIALAASFLVGDRWRDIEAGRRAGCRTVLLGNGYGEAFPSAPDFVVSTLREATEWILAQSEGG